MIESSLRLQRLMKQPLRWLVLREACFHTKQNVSHRTFNSGSFCRQVNFIFPMIMLVCHGRFDVKVSSLPKLGSVNDLF